MEDNLIVHETNQGTLRFSSRVKLYSALHLVRIACQKKYGMSAIHKQVFAAIAKEILRERCPEGILSDPAKYHNFVNNLLKRCFNEQRQRKVQVGRLVKWTFKEADAAPTTSIDTAMRAWCSVESIANGFNSFMKGKAVLTQMMKNVSGEKHNQLFAPPALGSLQLSLLNSDDIRSCLTQLQKDAIMTYSPIDMRQVVPRICKKQFGSEQDVLIENVLTLNGVNIDYDIAPLLQHPSVISHVCKIAKHEQGKVVHIHTSNVADLREYLNEVKERNQLSFTVLHYTPDRWNYVDAVVFSMERFVWLAVQHPELVVDDLAERDRNHTREAPSDAVLIPIIWVDGWRDMTASVKCRLFDPAGTVIRTHITAPFRLLEIQGQEKDLIVSFDLLAELVSAAMSVSYSYCVGDTEATVTLKPGFILGDHKALQILCGVPRGGDYPCPLSTTCRKEMATLPFKCSIRFSILDLVFHRDRAMNSTTDTGMDLLHFGRWQQREIEAGLRPIIFQDYGSLNGFSPFPPIMHNSFNLMKIIWKIVASLTEVTHSADNDWKRRVFLARTDFQRTTGCLEQATSRKLIAELVNEHISCLHPELHDMFTLLAQLQSLYYSKKQVTDNDIKLAYVAGMCCHLLSSLFFGKCEGAKPTFSADEQGVNAQSLFFHDIVAVIPPLLEKFRIPLGYLLEETFERDFVRNNEEYANSHRAKIIQSLVLKKQVNVLYKLMANAYSAGTKASHVPLVASPVKSVGFCDCMFNMSIWNLFRNRVMKQSEREREGKNKKYIYNWDTKSAAFSEWQDNLTATKNALMTKLDTNELINIQVAREGSSVKLCICRTHSGNNEATQLILHRGTTGMRQSSRLNQQNNDL